MKLSALTIATAIISRAFATRPKCLVEDTGIAQMPTLSHFNTRAPFTNSTKLPPSIEANVHFHIVSSTNFSTIVTDEIVQAQWDVLYTNYAKHNITLTLKSILRTVDDLAGEGFLNKTENGYEYMKEEETAFLKSTRQGGYDEMNLYFFAPFTPGSTGICTFPTTVSGGVPKEGDDAYELDLCKISALTMPGIPAELSEEVSTYTLGRIAVHEAGHWFGLNHTFAGGCSEPGDYVADTPPSLLTYDCVEGTDTCPDAPGLDPIHNIMGYTDDSWYVDLCHGPAVARSSGSTTANLLVARMSLLLVRWNAYLGSSTLFDVDFRRLCCDCPGELLD
jgi:hypothetical protein